LNDKLLSVLAYLPTVRQRLYAKASLLLPIELDATKMTRFSFVEITPKPRPNRALLARIVGPPNESVYADCWRQTHLNRILAEDSFLKSESVPRNKFLEAFDNGPPRAYGAAKYGTSIGAAMLYFEHDLAMEPENCEKGWKGRFVGTFIKWSHENSTQRFEYYTRDFPSKAYAKTRQKNPFPWTLGFHVHTKDNQKKEHVQIFTDETEDIILDVVGNTSSVRDAFETYFNDIKTEKDRIQMALREGKLLKYLIEKTTFLKSIESRPVSP
jgi:hypothetical protein